MDSAKSEIFMISTMWINALLPQEKYLNIVEVNHDIMEQLFWQTDSCKFGNFGYGESKIFDWFWLNFLYY